jgi:UPF0755 protein
MRKRNLIASIVVIICSLILGRMYLYYQHSSTENAYDVYINLKKNTNIEDLTKQLQEKNVIESKVPFMYYVKIMGLKENVEDVNFIIKPKTKLTRLITKLKDGKSEFIVITIPEGYTLYQIASKLEESNLIKKEDLLDDKLNVLKNNTLILSKKNVYYDLEGYLFPDTYFILNGTTKDEITNIMVNRFKTAFPNKYVMKAKELGLDVNEVITIASLIEKEAANDSDRSRIAGVIYNRLKKEMPLQVDAAVIYATTKGKKSMDKVYYKTLKVESKYNNYLHVGLPPGPIASPGKASIQAALYPEENDYLYYVASPSGHVFSKTYNEHLKNVKKYIK